MPEWDVVLDRRAELLPIELIFPAIVKLPHAMPVYSWVVQPYR